MRSGSERERRPRLTPAIADIRRAVREALADLPDGALVLVALSGGRDSLALAAATAFEAPRRSLRAGAIVVDHGLQDGSGEVAARAASAARSLGLDPVVAVSVVVERGKDDGGPEAAARRARYRVLDGVRSDHGAACVLLGHTLDDQAESVLLGLARGSGPASVGGMRSVSGVYRRPLLDIRRAQISAFCTESGLEPWDDPHNEDPSYARVRVRSRVLPVLEDELGPGIAEALARTAALLHADADALDVLAERHARALAEREDDRIRIRVDALAALPDAVASRVVRLVLGEFGTSPTATHTDRVLALVRDWRGQRAADLPHVRVSRADGRLLLERAQERTEGR